MATMATVLSGCSVVPSDGPAAHAVYSLRQQPGFRVIPISAEVARAAAQERVPGLRRDLPGNAPFITPALGAGDVVSVTIWESVDGGLFAGGASGGRNASLKDIRLDRHGMAFIPYAGRLRLGGKSLEDARHLIQRRLSRETLKPQVELRLISDKKHRVVVTGSVGKPGLYPLNLADGSGNLIEMIARAGGAKGKPHSTEVKIVRSKRQGTINLGRLYSSPRHDVNLRPGDKVILSDRPRTFSVLGAVGKSSEHEFSKWDFALADALALSGGLDDERADRTGVFVFRFELPEVVKAIRQNDQHVLPGGGHIPVIYHLDVSQPQALFSAKAFRMRDRDTLLVTNAPLHQWNKVLTAASKAVFLARSGVAVAD